MSRCNCDQTGSFLGGMFIGVILMMFVLFFSAIMSGPSFEISQETAQDICKNFTGNSTVEAKVEYGKLICEIPSFDSTTNIIIRKAGDSE